MMRLLPPVLIGLLISIALFWLMQAMILNNQQGLGASEKLQMVEFVRLKRDTKTQRIDRKKPEPPPPKKRPPPPKMLAQKTVVKNNMPDIDMPNIDIPMQNSRFSGSLIDGIQAAQSAGISNDIIPLVRTQPRYPMRAQSRRIQGWVKVEFTITTLGTVKNPIVVAAKPPGMFDRSALKAIAKWKFKAKIIDGEAVEQRAIQTLEFKLAR